MQPLVDWLAEHIVVALLVLTRLSTMMAAVPAIGEGVPRRVKVMLAVTITALLLPTIASRPAMQHLPDVDHVVDLGIAVLREAMIGMLIGATVQIVITGIQLAGEAITSTSGMQLGESMDETTQTSMPVLARMVGMLVTAVMLLSGGHRVMLSLLVESFDRMPPGSVVFYESMMLAITDCMSGALASGVRVSAPIVAALLLSNLVTGLISRTMPQINVLAVGLSVNALAFLVVTSLTIGSAAWIFQDDLAANVERLSTVWQEGG